MYRGRCSTTLLASASTRNEGSAVPASFTSKCVEGEFLELLRLLAPAFGRWHHAHERKGNTKEDPWPTPRRTSRRCSPTTTWPSTTGNRPRRHKSTAVLSTTNTNHKPPSASRRSSS